MFAGVSPGQDLSAATCGKLLRRFSSYNRHAAHYASYLPACRD